MATDEPITADSQAAKNTTGQTMALVVYQRLPLHDNGTSRHVDDFNPMDEKFVAQQSIDVDEDDYVPPPPLCTVRPDCLVNEQEKYPGFQYEGAKKPRTKETSTGPAKTYTRKRGRPLGSKSAKGMVEQKPALCDGSSGSSSYSKDDDFEPPTQTRKRRRQSRSKSSKGKIDYVDSSSYSSEGKKDIEPPTPTRKIGRPARSKSSKSKISYVDSSSSSSSEGHKDCDFEIEVSDDDDDGHKKYARAKGTALERAEKVNEKLPPDGPSFVKCMKKSHVSGGYWLGLPAEYCRENLPNGDVYIVLEDEEGKSCKTWYLAYKTGLSGGWGRFAKRHKLKVGDALVFQLVEPTRFKVYILRKNTFTTTDGALGLLSLDTSVDKSTSKKQEKESSDKDTKSKKVPRKKKKNVPEVVTRVSRKPSSNYSHNLASEDAAGGGIRYGGPDTGDFFTVESLEDFKILVGDGSVVGHVVLPDRLRMAYYTLCHDRKAFLHRHLSKHVCTTLATGMIVQTASIAEGIMAASPALEDLVSWKNTLQSLESMGMDVAFMRERVDKLIDLLSTPLSTMEVPEGYAELKLERARLEKQVEALESRVSNLKNAVKEMDVEMEDMLEAIPEKKRDQTMWKLATAPW